MAEEITRREFVKAGVVLAAGVAVGANGGCAPRTEKTGEVATPSRHFGGGDEMSKRVLVGYATRTGSTVGVAEKIGEVLGQRGFSVDVKPLREHPSVDGYDAVVLGSAINGGQWLPEALSYLQSNAASLGKMPMAAYCVHSMNGGTDAKQTAKRVAYLNRVRAVVKPVDEGFFLGKGPTADDTSLIARWAFKAFGGTAEGDARDWEKIAAWAEKTPV